MNNIGDSITQEYIDVYLESAHKVEYYCLTERDGVRTYFYDELPSVDVDGYPISSDYVLDGQAYDMQAFMQLPPEAQRRCRLRYYYMPYYHEMYVGTTGSGKTTGCVEPQLRAVSSQRNKPNFFITDPKGELFNRNAEHLKQQGYRLFILNFKELGRSDRWNPLTELYDLQARQLAIENDVCYVEGPVPDDMVTMCDPACLQNGYYRYDHKAFATEQDVNRAITFDRDVLNMTLDSMITQMVNMFIEVKNTRDPTWEKGAQDALKGIILAMLDDAARDPAFTREMFTLKTVQDYFGSLRAGLVDTETYSSMNMHPLLKNKPARVLNPLACTFSNARSTMRCYCGEFETSMKDWLSGHILALTTGNTVQLDDSEQPFAIFVVTRDYEKSDFQVAGLFIDWVYRSMLQAFENGTTRRDTHFMLDEFGNIPKIRNFENKIATARSRHIWFHLVVQSYKQLDAVYGEMEACIIRDNCNSQVFLGSQNYETKAIFSKECGNHYIPSLSSIYDSHVHELTLVPLIPVSDIEQIPTGTIIIKRLGCPIIFGRYIRSYVAAAAGTFQHFVCADGLRTLSPSNFTPFTGKEFTYYKIAGGDSSTSFRF